MATPLHHPDYIPEFNVFDMRREWNAARSIGIDLDRDCQDAIALYNKGWMCKAAMERVRQRYLDWWRSV